jgi:transcriptional regulator with XRE-family HTH domain
VPVHPAEFWELPELRDALAAQDFGQVLRAYRRAQTPPIKQSQLGLWFGITQGQISRIERGEAFDYSIDKLRKWASVVGIPQQLLWFRAEAHSPDSYDDAADSPSVQDTYEATGEGVQRRQFLKAASRSALGVGASLLGATTVAGGPNPAHRSSVGSPEVDLLREMTGAFRRVDNRYGGGHSRTAVGTYLKTMVEPMLTEGRARSAIRDELFGAAAELHQLAGWMAYDTGQAQAGRGHLRTALRLCQESNNGALSAEMLAAMSHQAAFHGLPEAAVDLALAARQTARQAGLPLLQAEAAVMEAHGLALQGDKQGCLAALSDAENSFSVASGKDVPEWLTYFDSAYLSAKFAHTFRDLGQPREAEDFARRSLEMSEGFERGRLFNTALLASIVADLGRLDEACSLGSVATKMASEVRSVRSMAYLADLARRLARHSETSEVSELYVEMVDAGIPVPTRS